MVMEGAESLGVPGLMFSECLEGVPAGGVVVRWVWNVVRESAQKENAVT
jgi:hypothetical protein